jgi:Domain of unknown function (DUF4124)
MGQVCELLRIRHCKVLHPPTLWSEDHVMMNLPQLIALAACMALAAAPTLAASPGSAEGKNKTYKWVDEKGTTHYGDQVPPEYARQGRSELNSHGVAVRQFPAQLSPEDAAAAQKVAAEKSKGLQHDQFLLTTYTSARDIEQLRDERLALLDGQMEIARGSIESVKQRIATLEARAANFKPYSKQASARRMPDQLAEEIVRVLHERSSLEATLVSKATEKREMQSRFGTDISRFKELAGHQPR